MVQSRGDLIPTLSQRGGLLDLLVGPRLVLTAFRLVLSTPKVRAWSALAFFVTFAALLSMVLGFAPLAHGLAEQWVGEGGWRSAAAVLLTGVLYVSMVIAGALTVPNLLLAPLQDPISEATETVCGGYEAPPFSVGRLLRGVAVSVAHTAARLLLLLLGLLVLLPLNLVPYAGSVAYAALSAAWAMWWLAAEYLSGPMARHLRPFSEVRAAMKARPVACLGFGAALYLLLWVPVLNCFLVPVAVVGGTLLFRTLQAGGVIPR